MTASAACCGVSNARGPLLDDAVADWVCPRARPGRRHTARTRTKRTAGAEELNNLDLMFSSPVRTRMVYLLLPPPPLRPPPPREPPPREPPMLEEPRD